MELPWFESAMADPFTDLTDAQLQDVTDILNKYAGSILEEFMMDPD